LIATASNSFSLPSVARKSSSVVRSRVERRLECFFVIAISLGGIVLTMSLHVASLSALEIFMPTNARRKDDVIQIRTSAEAKAILNRAAALRGQKLSEFMLESARREAEEAILDQRTFFLDDDAHARFLALLDAPPNPSSKVRARLRRKAPWEA
jgi:uncharacterized protein (DUF1778 family)